MKNKETLSSNEKAFSSNMDSLIFLLLISISAVILMPAVMAEYQYRSAGYVSLQDTDTLVLSSMLNSRIDEAGYTYKPGELVGLNISLPQDSMLRDAEETLYGRQQKHRTFADLVAEDLVLGMALSVNGSKEYLNPTAKMHRPMTEDAIRNYLDARVGGRYQYRFEAHWYPVSGYDTGSDIAIGDIAPADAFRQSSRISLPIVSSPSQEEFLGSMNKSVFLDALNASDPSATLHEEYNKSIERISLSAAETITSVIFPADYLLSLSSAEISLNSEQLSLISGPGNTELSNPEYQLVLYSIDHTANRMFGLNVTVPIEDGNIDINLIDHINNTLIQLNSARISSYMQAEMQPEIDATVSGILNSTDTDTQLEMHERQMLSIYSKASKGGADIVLYMWQ